MAPTVFRKPCREFAQLVYISSWLKHYHPDAFCCGLLNSQPMGFYAPAQIVGDARKNGVEVREIDVSYSFSQNTLEEGRASTARCAWASVRSTAFTGSMRMRRD
ncbi:hypothetical protein ACFIOY_17420 [Bradyrhizobium sp. TZ2]